MENIKLQTQLVNGILQYLGNRPYAEVFQLIEAIQKQANEQAMENSSNEVTSG